MNRSAKYLSGSLFFLATMSGLFAQEVFTPLAGNPMAEAYHSKLKRVKKSAATADTLNLPIFDDFSSASVEPDQEIWSDASAFINNNYCVDPVTNGVATLDALDFNGSIYPGATYDPTSFVADHLTSHPIRLRYPAGDSIYLSFLYQPRGLGDKPEEQDSLLVDFYNPVDSVWINVWGIPGTDLHPFRHVMIPITGEGFLNTGFRFRFRNRASFPRNNDYPDKRANLDHWHLDYIRLDINRYAADTVLRDVAFNTPLQAVLVDLTSLPWAHYEEAYYTMLEPTIPVRYRNNDTISRNVTRSLVIDEPFYNETYSPGAPTAQDLPAMKDTVVEFEYIYPIDYNRGDSALVRFKASLRTDEFDPKVNDTVVHDQWYKDYYSYDDGTPEAGYGLRGQGTRNANVAMKYNAFEADELGGVDISFNQLLDSVNLKYYFKLIVWGDNEGKPGMVLFEDEDDHVPVYTKHFPGFVRFYFAEPVRVDGTFYVGWRQYNEYMLNVGLDLNNHPNPHVMFYNYQGTWELSKAPGVLLLRPFLYDETTDVEPIRNTTHLLNVYPNPASDHVIIRIPGSEHPGELVLELYDASGRLAEQRIMDNNKLDVKGLPAGIYHLKIQSKEGFFYSKLLINR
ncbi:MAG: T9SS type A sorting domain-containing protein [Bacteroidota bacterium]